MSGQGRFVGFSSPAWCLRHDQMAINNRWRNGEELAVGGDSVDVGFHDAQMRNGGGEMGAHHCREVAIEVLRRHVDLVSVGPSGNLRYLPSSSRIVSMRSRKITGRPENASKSVMAEGHM